jgi:hypothetical protein
MAYVIVFLAAVAAGLAVGGITLRSGRVAATDPDAWTGTYRERPATEKAATTPTPETATSSRRLPPDPNAQTRAIGAAGLAGAVIIGAGVIAFLGYLLWTMLRGLVS